MRRLLRFLPHLWALGVSAAAAVQTQASPFGTRPIVDERMYVEWAKSIASGDVWGHDVFFFDPLWAYVLAALLWLTHGSLLACRLFAAALSFGTVELVFRTAARLGSPRTGFIAAALTALYGPLAFASGFLLKESLAVHGVAWAAFLMARAEGRRWLPVGVCFGLLALLRGNFLLVAVLPIAMARRSAPWVVAGLACPLSLSLAHNVALGGQWVPTTAHGGANFWLGNNPGSSGTYEAPEFIVARPASELTGFKVEAERRLQRPLTHAESSRYWALEGLQFWADQPFAALALSFTKLRLLLHDYEVPDNYSFTCFRRWFTPGLWAAPLSWGWLLPLALLGMTLTFAEPRSRRLTLFAIVYGATVVAFFVFDRYRIPLAPLLCLFAALGLDRLRAAWLEKRRWTLAITAAMAGLGLVAAWLPTGVSSQRVWHEAQCVGTAGLQLQADGLAEGERWLELATQLEPERWPAQARRRLQQR